MFSTEEPADVTRRRTALIAKALAHINRAVEAIDEVRRLKGARDAPGIEVFFHCQDLLKIAAAVEDAAVRAEQQAVSPAARRSA